MILKGNSNVFKAALLTLVKSRLESYRKSACRIGRNRSRWLCLASLRLHHSSRWICLLRFRFSSLSEQGRARFANLERPLGLVSVKRKRSGRRRPRLSIRFGRGSSPIHSHPEKSCEGHGYDPSQFKLFEHIQHRDRNDHGAQDHDSPVARPRRRHSFLRPWG